MKNPQIDRGSEKMERKGKNYFIKLYVRKTEIHEKNYRKNLLRDKTIVNKRQYLKTENA